VYEKDLAASPSTEARIDPDKVYELPELIDIAESTNPQPRVAWERARQAAAAVGLSKSAYYPYLAGRAALSCPIPDGEVVGSSCGGSWKKRSVPSHSSPAAGDWSRRGRDDHEGGSI